MTPLDPSFFSLPTLQVAQAMICTVLVRQAPDGTRLSGRIVETEAYTADDPAMHGWKALFGPDGLVVPEGRAAALFASYRAALVGCLDSGLHAQSCCRYRMTAAQLLA